MGGAGGEKKGDIVAILMQNYAIDKSSELFKHLIKRVFCNLYVFKDTHLLYV